MKKKRELEADLDPADKTRPGDATAKRALELTKGQPAEPKKRAKTRPGARAAERPLAQIKRRR